MLKITIDQKIVGYKKLDHQLSLKDARFKLVDLILGEEVLFLQNSEPVDIQSEDCVQVKDIILNENEIYLKKQATFVDQQEPIQAPIDKNVSCNWVHILIDNQRQMDLQMQRNLSLELFRQNLLGVINSPFWFEYQGYPISRDDEKDTLINDMLNEREQICVKTFDSHTPEEDHKMEDISNPQTQVSSNQVNNNLNNDIHNDNERSLELIQIEHSQIYQLFQDANSMPGCSEKSLSLLLFYIYCQREGQGFQNFLQDKIMIDDINQLIAVEMVTLEQKLKDEDVLIIKTQTQLQHIDSYVQSQQWKSAFKLLEKMLQKSQVIDIRTLKALIGKVDRAASLIKDKDIVLFLGGSGSGKSTTIHYLAGSKMLKTTQKGLTHYQPFQITNPMLADVRTSSQMKSCTRYITAVNVEYKSVGGQELGEMMLVDSPGFEDTSGVEVDIANGVGIIKAVHGCQSVRPVILISNKNIGDRMTGVKNLAKLLINMIDDLSKYIAELTYVFTKYSEEEKNQINAQLTSLVGNLTESEKNDKSFFDLLLDLQEQTLNQDLAIDLQDEMPRKLLSKIKKAWAISDPKSVFKTFMTQKSYAKINKYIKKTQHEIQRAITRGDYALIKYRLDQIQYLSQQVPKQSIVQSYGDSCGEVETHLTSNFDDAIEQLSRCFLIENALKDGDVEQFKEKLQQQRMAHELITSHLKGQAPQAEAFVLFLTEKMKTIAVEITQMEVQDPGINLKLNKILQIANYFDQFNPIYQEIIVNLTSKQQAIVEAFKQSIIRKIYDQASEQLEVFRLTIKLYSNHMNQKDQQGLLTFANTYLINYIQKLESSKEGIFAKNLLSQSEIDQIDEVSQNLSNIQIAFKNAEIKIQEEISEINDSFVKKIMRLFDSTLTRIDDKSLMQSQQQYFDQMKNLRQISAIEINTTESYLSTIGSYNLFINDQKREIESLISLISQQYDFNNYQRLFQSLKALEGLQWFEDYQCGAFDQAKDTIKQKLVSLIQTLEQNVNQKEITLENPQFVQEADQKIKELNGILELKLYYPEIVEPINAIINWFKETISNIFDEIISYYDKSGFNNQNQCYEILDGKRAKNSLKFLKQCSNLINIGQKQCNDTRSKVISTIGSQGKKAQELWKITKSELQNYTGEESQKAQIADLSGQLHNLYYEAQSLETNYKEIFLIFSSEEIWRFQKRELVNLVQELREDMEQQGLTNNLNLLQVKLFLAKNLRIMDEFLSPNQTFLDLYQSYQNKFYKNAVEQSKQIVALINQCDYHEILNQFTQLQQSTDAMNQQTLEKLKTQLTRSIQEIIDESIILVLRMRIRENFKEDQKMLDITKNLKNLNEADKYLQDYLAPDISISDSKKNILETLSQCMVDYMKFIKGLIENDNFHEASSEMDRINVLCGYQGSFALKRTTDENQELQNIMDKALEKVVERFTNMEIDDYPLNPPKDIFEKLKKDNSNDNNPTLKQIRDIILDKLRAKLDKIKKIIDNSERGYNLRKFESTIKTLPNEIKLIIEEEFTSIKLQIERNLEDAKEQIDKYIQNDDIKQIIIVYTNEKIAGNKKILDDIRQGVIKKIFDSKAYIEKNISYDFDIELQNHLIKLRDYKNFIQQHMPQENLQAFEEIKSKIDKQIAQKLKVLQKFFQYDHLKINLENQIQQMNRSFDTFLDDDEQIFDQSEVSKVDLQWIVNSIEFLNRKKNTFEDMYIQFEPQVVNEFQNINKTLIENQKKYNDSMNQETIDIAALKIVLKFMKKRESALNFLRENIDKVVQFSSQKLKCLTKTMKNQISYQNIIENVSYRLQSMKKEFLRSCEELANDRSYQTQADREKIYFDINEQYQILSQTKLLSNYKLINFNIQSVQQECIDKLNEKFNLIIQETEKVLISPEINMIETQNFNKYYNQIDSFVKCINCLGANANIDKNMVYEKFERKIQDIQYQIDQEQDLTVIADLLIKIQTIAENVQAFKQSCDDKINKSIERYKKIKGQNYLHKLGILLDQNPYGKLIVQFNKSLEGFLRSLTNQKFQKHDIDHVINHLKGTDIDKMRLRGRYDIYIRRYDKLIKDYLVPDMDLSIICNNLKNMIGNTNFKQKSQGAIQFQLKFYIYDKFSDILAHISALWTLLDYRLIFENQSNDNKELYLFRPHAAQIISILRIFGSGDSNQQLSNNLVEILTGEGKSLILAITSALFALFGFDVNCTCYSSYLSQRDYQSFRILFELLGVDQNIYYGTFGNICEIIINQNGDVREIISNLLTGTKQEKQVNQQPKRPKILLVDEVDVFFSKDFYGKTYSPNCSLRDPTISALIMLIWSLKDRKINLKTVQETNEYKQVQAKFSKWHKLIDNSVENMISDVNNFQTPSYEVQHDKIGYKDQDGIAFNIIYGYKTVFAYVYENSIGKITPESLQDNLSIQLNCGQFSFAEIPSQFKYIMGVTGTLDTLSESEKRVVKEEYSIQKFTFLPSVFGKNNRIFQSINDCKVENQDDYYMQLAAEINRRMVGTNPETKRAVLVFFEDVEALSKFYQSNQYEHILMNDTLRTLYLTEKQNKQEKESIVQQATLSGKISFYTKCFGRGTDFITRDEIVSCNGGLHVIQTFLSEDVSEEIQIKGRTARQGELGSFSMVLLDKSLEKFLVTIEDINNNKGNIYEYLCLKRQVYFNDQYNSNKQYVDIAKILHQETQELLKNIQKNNLDYVRHFLEDRNKGVKVISTSKTLVAMDGTGSMSSLIFKAKNTVGLMFERAYQCLLSQGYEEGCFQLQFCIYRSYNSEEKDILEVSGWETKPENLRTFIQQVQARGGYREEAVEVALQYANQINIIEPLSQVILIGDAPPTPLDQIDKIRAQREDWKNSRFEVKTDYIQETQKLKASGVQVHAFYVHMCAQKEFQTIAQATGGDCNYLDVNSEKGANMLTEIVTTTILRNVGKKAGKGEQLVNEYNKRYKQ